MVAPSPHRGLALLMVFMIILLCFLIAQQFGFSFTRLELAARSDFQTVTSPTEAEAVMILSTSSPDEAPDVIMNESQDKEIIVPTVSIDSEYIRVKDSCDPFFTGECVRVRSGPGLEYPVITRVRNDMVLKVDRLIEGDGIGWYNVVFDEWLRYPERLQDDWYIASDFAEPVLGKAEEIEGALEQSNKKIIIDRSEQKLYAYAGEELFMESNVSTGLELTPTPRGTFSIFKKLPSRYMQGPLPYLQNSKFYDLPGVPWNLYFTEQGAVIHGAYWHKSFGSPYSHGCVNLLPEEAKKLYEWASLGTTVMVQE